MTAAEEIYIAVQKLAADAHSAGAASRDGEVAALKAELQAARPAPAPTPTSVKFPVGVSLSAKGNRGGLTTGWPAYRVYITADCPPDITSHSDIKTAMADPACRYIFLSWKDTDQSRVKAMLASAKANLTAKGITVDCAYFHEMEDNMAGSAFLPVAKAHREIAQAAGLKFGPMYQSWTFNPKSGRNWRDWWDAGSDFLGVEAYNPGRKKTPPVFEPPGEYLDRVFAALTETGKPTAAGEFGMPVDPGNPATRPAYIKSVVNYYRTECPTPVRSLLYWDSVVTNDNRLDRAAAQALQSMNA